MNNLKRIEELIYKYAKDNRGDLDTNTLAKVIGTGRAIIMNVIGRNDDLKTMYDIWRIDRLNCDAKMIKDLDYVGRRRLSRHHLSEKLGIPKYRIKLAIDHDDTLSEWDRSWNTSGMRKAVEVYMKDASESVTKKGIAKFLHIGSSPTHDIIKNNACLHNLYVAHNKYIMLHGISESTRMKIKQAIIDNHSVFDFNDIATRIGIRQCEVTKYIEYCDDIKLLHATSRANLIRRIQTGIKEFVNTNGYYDTREIRDKIGCNYDTVRRVLSNVHYIDMVPTKRQYRSVERSKKVKHIISKGEPITRSQIRKVTGYSDANIFAATRHIKCHGNIFKVMNDRELKKHNDITLIRRTHEVLSSDIGVSNITRKMLIDSVCTETGYNAKTVANLVDTIQIIPRTRVDKITLRDHVAKIISKHRVTSMTIQRMDHELISSGISVDIRRISSTMECLGVLSELSSGETDRDVVDRRISILYDTDSNMTNKEYVLSYQDRFNEDIDATLMYYGIKKMKDSLANDNTIREYVVEAIEYGLNVDEAKFTFFIEHPTLVGNNIVVEDFNRYYKSINNPTLL